MTVMARELWFADVSLFERKYLKVENASSEDWTEIIRTFECYG